MLWVGTVNKDKELVKSKNSSEKDILSSDFFDNIEKTGHKSVFVVCSHSDDQVLGPGGTLAKFAKEGVSVKTIIFSYGELTPAWIKHKYTIEARVSESEKADKIIGGNGVEFLGLKEGKFIKEAKEKDIYEQLKKRILKEKPSIIFTHMKEDPHKDHKDTLSVLVDVIKQIPKDQRPDVYSFGIWNPFTIHRREPHLVVDISDTFKKKLDAMKCFKSQRLVILQLTPGVMVKAKFNGWSRGYKYAEAFRKVYVE